MNRNVTAYMAPGTGYGSRIGIQGIQAASRSEADFFLWADGLDNEWDDRSTRYWYPASEVMSPSGMLFYPDRFLVFVSGATSQAHGLRVVNGILQTSANAETFGLNNRIVDAIRSTLGPELGDIAERNTHGYFFGHSYGGAVASCFAELSATLNPVTRLSCETYGSPRSLTLGQFRPRGTVRHTRNVNALDVVSHVPFKTDEAPYASRFLDQSALNALNRGGHPCNARVFAADGSFIIAENNVLPVQDTTLSILAWVTYSQHLTHRSHELATYVSVMNAFALRDRYGVLPADSVSTPIPAGVPSFGPVSGALVSGSLPPVVEVAHGQALAEEAARVAFRTSEPASPAVPVAGSGLFSAGFGGENQVPASSRSHARWLSKILNRLRRTLGPLTADQRKAVLDAVTAEFF